MSEVTFTLDEVVEILTNVGVDMSCGSCAEAAFTGRWFHPHTCGKTSDVVFSTEVMALFPKEDPEFDKAVILWCKYHVGTENYDRQLNHRRLRGTYESEVHPSQLDLSRTYAYGRAGNAEIAIGVLKLTDEQKIEAKDYAKNLSPPEQARIAGEALLPLQEKFT